MDLRESFIGYEGIGCMSIVSFFNHTNPFCVFLDEVSSDIIFLILSVGVKLLHTLSGMLLV